MYKYARDPVLQGEESAELGVGWWSGECEAGADRSTCVADQVQAVLREAGDEGGRWSVDVWTIRMW